MVTLGTAFVRVRPDADGFDRETNRVLHPKLANVAKGVGIAFLGATAGLAKGLQVSVGKASAFDKTIRQVGATSGTSGKGLKQLTDLAIDMGAKTTFSAQGAGDAMVELAKGGLSAAQIKAGALQSTLTLATAGGLELGNAATYIVQGLTSFGLKAKDAGQVAAALAGGANASTASVESLGRALSQVGPGAKLAGLSLQDTTAALAAFDNAGLKGQDAGTSLKTFLTNLVPTTDKAQAQFESLGLSTFSAAGAMKVLRENGIKPLSKDQDQLRGQLEKLAAHLSGSKVGSATATKAYNKLALSTGVMSNAFFDAKGNIKSISDVSQTLQTALKGQTKEQKIATLSTLFGSDAARAAAVLAENGTKGLAKYVKATNDQTQAQKLAKVATQGYAGAQENLQGSIETLQIQAGRVLLPILTKITNTVAKKVVPAVSGFFTQMQSGTGAGGKFVAVVKSIGSGLASTAGFLNRNRGLLVALGVIIAGVAAGMVAFRVAQLGMNVASAISLVLLKAQTVGTVENAIVTKAAAVASKVFAAGQWLVNAALSANPIALVVIAIAALVGGLIYAYKHSETFRKIVSAAFDGVKRVAKAVFDWLAHAVGAVIDFVRNHWKLIVGILGGPLAAAVILIHDHWDTIRGWFTKAKDWVVNTWKTSWHRVSAVLTDPVGSAKGAIGRLLSAAGLLGVFTRAKDWVVGVFKREWAGLKLIFTDPVQAAKNAIHNILGPLGLEKTFTNAVAKIGHIWDKLKGLAKAPIRFIVETVLNNGLIAGFNKVAGFVGLDGISRIQLPKGFSAGGYTGKVAATRIAGVVHGDEQVIRSWARRRIEHRHPGVLDDMNRTGEIPGYFLGGLVGRATSKIGGFVSGLKDTLLDPAGALRKVLDEILTAGGSVLDSPIGRMLTQLPRKLIAGLVSKIQGAFTGGDNPFGAPDGGNGRLSASQINGLLMRAMVRTGMPSSTLDNWFRQVMSESGGNPNAVQGNIGDVNNRSGDLAKGLLQVIGATFAAYRDPMLPNNRFNPFANAVAAMRYTLARYGIDNIEGVIGHGHGYANGTRHARSGWARVGERGPELVRFGGGERVYSNADSKKFHTSFGTPKPDSSLDVWRRRTDDALAKLLARTAQPQITRNYYGSGGLSRAEFRAMADQADAEEALLMPR